MKALNFFKSSAVAMSAFLVSLFLVHAGVSPPVHYEFGTGISQEDPTDPASDFKITLDDNITSKTLPDAFRFERPQDTSYENALAVVDVRLRFGRNFLMAIDTVNIERNTGNFTRYGFTFLGSGGNSLSAIFIPRNGDHGKLRIRQGLDADFGGPDTASFGEFDRTAGSAGSDSEGSEHSFYLEGVFQANGDLTLTFSVVDLGDSPDATNTLTTTIAAGDLPPGLGGEFGVGVRMATHDVNGSFLEFDNLSVVASVEEAP